MSQEVWRSSPPDCRPAGSRAELEAAYRIVYRCYVECGYIEKDPSGMRVTVFNALPDTTTFTCVLRGEVVSTATVVADSPAGLPVDQIYRTEVDELRRQGRKPVEAIMLADRRHSLARTKRTVSLLMKRTLDLAMFVLQADDMVITINPRHDVYYFRRLLFEPIGEPKAHPSVQDNPALGKRLDLRTIEARCAVPENEWQHRLFFENRTPVSELRRSYHMTPDDLRYFFIDRTDTFRQAPKRVMDYLRKVRPDCPWAEWGFPGESD